MDNSPKIPGSEANKRSADGRPWKKGSNFGVVQVNVITAVFEWSETLEALCAFAWCKAASSSRGRHHTCGREEQITPSLHVTFSGMSCPYVLQRDRGLAVLSSSYPREQEATPPSLFV